MSRTIRNSGGTAPTQYNHSSILFDYNSTKNTSVVFRVDDDPVVISAFLLGEFDEIRIEKVFGGGSVNEIYSPFCPFNGQAYLDDMKNIELIGLPGQYRLVLERKDGSKPSIGQVVVSCAKVAMTQEVITSYLQCCSNRGE